MMIIVFKIKYGIILNISYLFKKLIFMKILGLFVIRCEECNKALSINPEETEFINISGATEKGNTCNFIWEPTIYCDCGNEYIEVEYTINIVIGEKINWTNINIHNAEILSEFGFGF